MGRITVLTPNYFTDTLSGKPEPWFYGPVDLEDLPDTTLMSPNLINVNNHSVFELFFDLDTKTGSFIYKWSVFKGWEPVDPTKAPIWPGR